MATKPRNIFPATALALSFGAIAIAWGGVAEAKTGLAPVVAEGELGLKMAQKVERQAFKALVRNGVNPPKSATLLPYFGLASPTDPPTTAQCVAAGEALNLDIVVVIRVRPWADAVESEMRVVVVETQKEYRYVVRSDRSLVSAEVRALVSDVFCSINAWEGDLIAVEHALGHDEDKLYKRYLNEDDPEKATFAQYAYDRAERRRNVSLGLGIAIPIVLASATVWFGIATRGIWEDPKHDDDDESGVCIACGLGEILLVFGRFMVVIGYVAGAALTALSTAIPIVIYNNRKREMNRLRPLVLGASAEPPPISWNVAPYVSPEGGGLVLDLRF